MSVFSLQPFDTEVLSLATNHETYFVSSSAGVTGSITYNARTFKSLKELADLPPAFITDNIFQAQQDLAIAVADPTVQDVTSYLQHYFDKVNELESAEVVKEVERLKPAYIDEDPPIKVMGMKAVLSSTLMPYYRAQHGSYAYSYYNYYCVNFVSSSGSIKYSGIVYPNDGGLTPTDSFSLDFYINVRRPPSDVPRPGTVLHLSSCYAISVVSGTHVDSSGYLDSYGLLLQLSHSADIAPHAASAGPFPQDLIFKFDDVLRQDVWHHVIVRWDPAIDNGLGNLRVDGLDVGSFYVPSSSIASTAATTPDALVVGNYYDGVNDATDGLRTFFSADASTAYGVVQLDAATGVVEPSNYLFSHPGFFELHDLSVKDYYVDDDFTDVRSTPTTLSGCALYVPPYFYEETPARSPVVIGLTTHGGVPYSPTTAGQGRTSTPHSLSLSDGCGTLHMNLENHFKDMVTGRLPRFVGLHMSTDNAYYNDEPPDDARTYLDSNDQQLTARNYTLLPCDDGTFTPIPSFFSCDDRVQLYLVSGSVSEVTVSPGTSQEAVVVQGTTKADPPADFTNITSELFQLQKVDQVLGFSPQKYLRPPGPTFNSWLTDTDLTDPYYDRTQPTAMYWKYLQNSSNEFIVFNASSLFYGDSIEPGSVEVVGSVFGDTTYRSIVLRDDSRGVVYRADSESAPFMQGDVGNVFYPEGVIMLKHPVLSNVGMWSFSVRFRGSRNVHVFKIEAMAPRGMVNSSSNPSYIQLAPTANNIDANEKFVYVSGVNFHDEDFNIVARTKLAQPVVKRLSSRIMVKSKIDF